MSAGPFRWATAAGSPGSYNRNEETGPLSPSEMRKTVHIIGAGIAGLHCADLLRRRGIEVLIHESSDRVGGRMRTDHIKGFLIDHGFHVMQSGYERVRQQVDFAALNARAFSPGARVIRMIDGRPRVHTYADPFQAPLTALSALRTEKFFDLIRIARLRRALLRRSSDAAFLGGDGSTRDYLRSLGFTAAFVHRFLRPLFAGIFLESELATSERMFRFVFAAMAQGQMLLPENGIQAMPEQLAGRVGRDKICFGVEARANGPEEIMLGSVVSAAAQVILAHPEPEEEGRRRSVWTVHLDADHSPVPGGFLVLNGDYELGKTLIAHLAIPSDVQPSYAPPGRSLVTVTVVGDAAEAMGLSTPDAVAGRVRTELAGWFPESACWSTLAIQKISAALPAREAGSDLRAIAEVAPDDLIRCGDHSLHGSVEGAVRSAESAALETIRRLGVT
ncbi:MAG: phytoene dehydrogenase-like protein [Rhodothermales bacterium]|jgi:phytoene dehydrogenase-like protein